MKRRAILFYNDDGELKTKKDIDDMVSFLVSPTGGCWDDGREIMCRKNVKKSELMSVVEKTRKECIDYLFLYFSGHGGFARTSFIELNPDGERVSTNFLLNLADRQLSILDCCRSMVDVEKRAFAMDSIYEAIGANICREAIRDAFDRRVMAAYPQSMTLYACHVGEYAYDYGAGGVYTQNLLATTESFPDGFLLASTAHMEAYDMTVRETQNERRVQHPDFAMAKLPSRFQLPFAINPSQTV